ncbi:sigma-54-dependent transcriptional regulator [Calderihabitans maritimus]|uniref:Stage 0 sporulation protein A homolog n=1 Tax=Calderihabitans maritimus TaxID=1246530 RepID=A0A1Z5HPX1_9FIRM|nr:sigma-54 dependent transcriptional regulator [Calderihabitans maritimus]GAW91586.1 putative response regulator/sigma54 interaction protein [Calderihabitans maritimus]
MHDILIIDDEISICSSLSFALEDKYRVSTATNPEEALELIYQQPFSVILLDWRLGSTDGLDVLRQIKHDFPNAVVIIMTAYGTIESAVEAMKSGAYYYITKPLDIQELQLLIDKAIEYYRLTNQVKFLSETLDNKPGYAGIIGKSKALQRVFRLVEKVKDIDSNVLITGESGTGKELVARAIHYLGKRREGPFEVINCAAIPETLLESELFGYEKGAFTGALQNKAGKLLAASGGTLLLDEIGEMPLSLQAKILRVIQEREVTPLGSTKSYRVDVRILAATNKDLLELVREKKFREDLYFRLNVIPIHIPPLRERREDILLLIEHFIKEKCQKMGKKIKQLDPETKRILLNHHYPGNVRQLENIIEYAVAISTGPTITPSDLPNYLESWISLNTGNEIENTPQPKSIPVKVGQSLLDIERETIAATLKYCNGHRKRTAKMLGISERSLREKIKKYNLNNII